MEGGFVGTRRLSKLVLVVATSIAMLGGVGLAHAAPSHSAPSPGPTSLTATVDRDGNPVRLSWKTGLETTDVVERSLKPDRDFAAISPAKKVRRAGGKASWRDSTVVLGTLYYYRVAGTTSGGTLYTSVVSAQAGATNPPGPTTTTTTTPGNPGGNNGGNAQWWKGFGNPSIQLGRKVAVDGSGEATFIATFYGWVNFGPASDDKKCVPPQSATGDDQPPSSLPLCIGFAGFASAGIVHMSADGTVRWARALRAQALGIDVDRRNGDVLVTGAFTGFTDFGAGCVKAHVPSTYHGSNGCTRAEGTNGYTDMFVARYTKNNALVWSRNYGVAASAARGWAGPSAIAVDGAGNSVVTGAFDDSVDFGSGTVTDSAPNGGRGVFLASYNTAGTPNWAKGFSPAGSSGAAVDASGVGVAADPQGNVAVTGFFKGNSLNLGHALPNKGDDDIFIAELTSSGAVTWSKSFGDTSPDRGFDVAFEPNGSLVATGYFGGTVNFGGGNLSNPIIVNGYGTFYEHDAFLVQFSPSGAHQWSKHFLPPQPNGNATLPNALRIGASGDIVLGGWLQASIDFGGGPLSYPDVQPNNDAFVAKFTAAGTHKWSHRWGTYPFDDGVNGVAVYPNGEVLAVGQFAKQIGPLTVHKDDKGNGLDDGFVLKLSS